MMQKHLENCRNPGTSVFIRECSDRAIQWTPTWQGLDGSQKCLYPCTWVKVASALEGLTRVSEVHKHYENTEHNSTNEVLFENIWRVVVYVYKNQTFSQNNCLKRLLCYQGTSISMCVSLSDHVYATIWPGYTLDEEKNGYVARDQLQYSL